MNKYDESVLGSLDIAQAQALQSQHPQLTPWHLALGFAKNPKSRSYESLQSQIPLIEEKLSSLPTVTRSIDLKDLKGAPELSQWLTLASSKAVEAGREFVSEEDLFSDYKRYLPGLSVDLAMEGSDVPDFLLNLNERAREGKLDPVIGRTAEIRAVIEILGRRAKNNPILVGPAGVGKTAIVEGLAEQIEAGQVPDVLMGKTVYSLDLGALMAGTKFRGEFEERLQKLLGFIKEQAGSAILFIDEIHQLVGAGKTDGAMDAANLLKPALARGELHCIGATTADEFQQYIMGDAALERRFRQVPVYEPSKEDAIEILMGLRQKHESHHGIKISDEAIYAAVMLSTQYLTDKNLPDKAIDLVDEAASSLKLSAQTMPAELQQLEAEIRSKKILAKVEKDNPENLALIEELEKKFHEQSAAWDKEVDALRQVAASKNTLDRAMFDLSAAERAGDYETASRLKYSVIPELEKQLDQYQHGWELGRESIAQVISRQTGIPVAKILQKQQAKILKLEEYLGERVFGQQSAISEIAETLMTAYAGLSKPGRPLGSFMLQGPTGVGKTETAKALAEYLFEQESNLIRFDLSEFSEKHAVAKLIGAPAGYVGYEAGGVLTEAVRRKPYSVILFDEIEKAHEDFADILLQILDDGRLTDNKGRTVSFANTVIMVTTNASQPEQAFKPEVLGRLDQVLTYQNLAPDVMESLVDQQTCALNERLQPRKIHIQLSASAKTALCKHGYDSTYGARPLHAVYNRMVGRPLSQKILAEPGLNPGSYQVHIDDLGKTAIEVLS